METELAVALSARDWSDELHRFLADHGGARVRLTVTGPEDLVAESFDVLLIDDICSFLTPRLVDVIHGSGRRVVGVYDPEEFADGKGRLLECGVADVVEAGAHPDEFLRVIDRVALAVDREIVPTGVGGTDDAPPPSKETGAERGVRLAVGGPPGGTGSTEIALAIARRLADSRGRALLIDGDDTAPSVAQRLGLPLHPNLRTAIDVLEHRTGSIGRVLQSVGTDGLRVLVGLPNVRDWAEVRPRQVLDIVGEAERHVGDIVVDVGSQVELIGYSDGAARYGMTRALLEGADRVVAVGLPTPVGVARLLDWVATVTTLRGEEPIDIIINRAPRDQFRRGEVVEEIGRSYRPASFAFVPEDDSLFASAWNGEIVEKGRFRRAVDRWVDRMVPAGAGR